MGIACLDCRYFSANEKPANGKKKLPGECRRNPPTGASKGVFPAVHSEMWCGEFVARLPATPLMVEPTT
jgi:hypothetical protein